MELVFSLDEKKVLLSSLYQRKFEIERLLVSFDDPALVSKYSYDKQLIERILIKLL